jgi:DNA-binding NtrC family response regulator
MPGKVMLVDDQPEVLDLLADLLKSRGRQTQGFQNGDQALKALASMRDEVDLVVLDLDLGPGSRNGMDVLADLKKTDPQLPVVILTGKGTVDDAVRAMHLGATDFIEKDPRLGERLDLQMEKLDRMLSVLRDNRRLQKQNEILRELVGKPIEMVGADSGLRRITEKIRALADIPRPVLIMGERGTGKELVAQALHQASSRSDGPFITVNCAALPATLVEAELFGHEKGAFTDARDGKPGKFELADGGTLFLDEVGNMQPAIQQKILRAIEYQSFERVRGSKPIKVNVRVTAATNADLDIEMKEGRFRRDLYDRLAFDTIRVPPLRQRREDIPELCRTFISRFRREVAGVNCTDISKEALELLARQSFPGNIRELKNMIERAAYRCQSETILPKDLDLAPEGSEQQAPVDGSLQEQVRTFERKLIERALGHADGNMAAAARDLGLGYDQMRRLVKKHKIGK